MTKPFVITVASEKGGVGKTTIATNLAVYLKALREDLPVTIASFDNHFSVDQMFALGPRPQNSVADLLEATPFEDLVNLGQYGVQYLASSKRLQPPAQQPAWLASRLADTGSPGVLILDTRPILDWFSEAALLAADIVLVPIKDRAALINADTIRQILIQTGHTDRLWLLPSLVDTRARLNPGVKIHEFLCYAAREREYQVLDIKISKSPKVEGLASGFSSCIRPVLTHARNTAVHGQLRQLADFVLKRFDSDPRETNAAASLSAAGTKRTLAECTVCARDFVDERGHFFFDMTSRRRGHVHLACYRQIVKGLEFDIIPAVDGVIALVLSGPGRVDLDCHLSAHCCDNSGNILESKETRFADFPEIRDVMEMMMGRTLAEAYREIVLLSGSETVFVDGCADVSFKEKRKRVVREIYRAGLF